MPSTQTVLVFGARGKMGVALAQAMAGGWNVVAAPRAGLDIASREALAAHLRLVRPAVVANAKVLGGVDACEADPLAAHQVNVRFPALLAELSGELGFRLLHFSTDAVLGDCQRGAAHTESSPAAPVNLYGLSKFGGDCLVRAIAPEALVLRLSLQFGPSSRPTQFVERTLARALAGEPELRMAEDVVCSPSYSLDMAARAAALLEEGAPGGLYHLANAGQASLFELMEAAVRLLGLSTRVVPVPSAGIPSSGRRSLVTPIASEKIAPLRHWREALAEFLRALAPERAAR